MTPERYRQIGDLYHAALDLEEGQRAAFLDRACAGDEALQREVESLIASHEQASGFIAQPALNVAAELLAGSEDDALIGQTVARYRVLSLLGAGGMGRVYLAEDTELGRRVALKFLPEYFTHDRNQLQRFRQEARAASALNHPNILTVYEVGQLNGTEFIATEYVEGETLRHHLAHTRTRLTELLEVAVQIASALAAAHQIGIIHRDIKPDNIMLRQDGLVKVLDFGLVKLTRGEGLAAETDTSTATLVATDPGQVMGTAHYMSPEQAQRSVVDARTDIWSLGVVLYEMAAGRKPFEGATASHVIVSVLEQNPEPLSGYAPDVPGELVRIISKALEKDREERYQLVKDLALDLKKLQRQVEFELELGQAAEGDLPGGTTPTNRGPFISAGTNELASSTAEISAHPTSSAEYLVTGIKRHKTGAGVVITGLVVALLLAAYSYFSRSNNKAPIDSIAVLPFANVSMDPNTEYLSDGVTESIISSLSQLPQLKVMARSTVFRYKGRETDPQQAGRELHVRAVLSGRVLKQGNNLVIRTELVNVADGTEMWGAEYSRSFSDVIIIQQEISREISEKLQLRLTGAEQQQLSKRYTNNTEAYELYLKGRYYWNKRTPEDSKKGVDYFRQAIAKDPNYALAYAGLADSYSVYPPYLLPPKQSCPQAKAAALKALEIDDSLAEAHTALAQVLGNFDWDWPNSEREFKRAIALNPNYAPAHYFYSYIYLTSMGRLDEALAEMKRAQELDPLSLIINTNLGLTLMRLGRNDEAIGQLKKALELDPNFVLAHDRLSGAYAAEGKYAQAIAEAKEEVKLGPTVGSGALAFAYACSGNRAEAMKLLKVLEEPPPGSYHVATTIASVYAPLGDKEQAFAWLEKGYEERDMFLARIKVDPAFENLHSDKRFADLVRRLGLPQ